MMSGLDHCSVLKLWSDSHHRQTEHVVWDRLFISPDWNEGVFIYANFIFCSNV